MNPAFWPFEIGPVAALSLGLSASVIVLTLADLYLIVIHLARSRREIERERTAPRVAEAPLVSIQVPVHDEPPAMVIQTLEALAALNYPNYEVVVIDNNTSDPAVWRPIEQRCLFLGPRFRFYHFAVLDGFKAGALREGLRRTDAHYLAFFDADYRPDSTFLRDTVDVLLSEPRAAFVQARVDFLNREANWLTRAQALELDTYYAYEQAARHWAGVPTTFKGTGAVWRREALDEAGGWSARSLVEDQDLSFRVFERGWRSRNLVSVAVAGELPDSFAALASQRRRWSAGAAQTLRDLPWRLLRHLRWHQIFAFVMLQQFYVVVPLCLVASALLVFTAFVWRLDGAAASGIGLLVALAAIVSTKSIGAALAARLLGRRRDLSFAVDLVRMWLLQLWLLPVTGAALLRASVSRQLGFVRTPRNPSR